jgi:DNA-binding response OmpR family regulator
MDRILIVDDDNSINLMLKEALEREGFACGQAYSGSECILMLRVEHFDLVLLDLSLPGKTGEEVLREIRENGNHMPVIVVSAKDDLDSKVDVLSIGADDYVTKPFSPSELMARVDVLYRRVEMGRNDAAKADSRRVWGDFVLDLRARTLQKRGVPIELTQVEFQMMEFFFENAGAALTRADILRRVWGAEYYGEEKIVDVNVRRLRMKLEDDPSVPQYLQTVWGVGYRWLG